ncbi:MAG: AAA family ATPase [Planctomycetes bacterium]|nr:AAA family ATPase [Planctomycetota bacterium]
MFTSIHIQGLRGIREGKLEGLARLTVLMGPSGCGKSTVLEALLLAASNRPPEALGRLISRRMGLRGGARYLFWARGDQSDSVAQISIESDRDAARLLQLIDVTSKEGRSSRPTGAELKVRMRVGSNWFENMSFSTRPDNTVSVVSESPGIPPLGMVRLIGNHSLGDLHDVYSESLDRGELDAALALFREVNPSMLDIRIATDDGTPVLKVRYPDGAVPVAAEGDGFASMVRMALELSGRSAGCFLLEDPDSHQHIAAMARSARVICAAVKAGAQIVLSTHSLELLDLLLDHAGEEGLKQLALFQLQLTNGDLRARRLDGEEIRFARATIEKDLR